MNKENRSCVTCGHGYKNKSKEGGKCIFHGVHFETDEEMEGTKCDQWVRE